MSAAGVTLIGVPIDLGAGRRGVDMGPSAFRIADIDRKMGELGYDGEDAGNLHVPIPETLAPGDSRLKYLKEIKEVCDTLREEVSRALSGGRKPVVLGG